jgi:hypothetical protein
MEALKALGLQGRFELRELELCQIGTGCHGYVSRFLANASR